MKRRITGGLGAAACALVLALPMAAASQATAKRPAWPAETLSGTIMMVEPSQHLLIVKGPGGVPFDIEVTGSTLIRSGSRNLTLNSLNSDMNRNVSVHFVPERSGDVARTVRIAG